MKMIDVKTEMQIDLWVLPLFEETKLAAEFVRVELSDTPGKYHITCKNSLVQVKLRDKYEQNNLDFYLRKGCARLAHVIQVAKDGSALLRICFFNGALIEMGKIDVGIDEYIVKTADKHGLKARDVKGLASLLKEKTVIEVDHTGEIYFMLTAGPAADVEFENDDQLEYKTDEQNMEEIGEESESTDTEEKTPPEFRCFCIHGDGLRIPVEKKRITKDKEIFFATRLTNKIGEKPDNALRLAHGSLSFSDYSSTGQIPALAAGMMSRLLQEKESYLRQWDEYGAIEGEILLARMRRIGKLEFKNTEPSNKGTQFFFDTTLPDELKEGDELEIVSQAPSSLRNLKMTWQQYSEIIEEEFTSKKERKSNDQKDEQLFAKITEVKQKSLTLDLPDFPSGQNKFLVLSINGDKTQIERRMKARKAIVEGRSANPLLGILIEEDGEPPNISRVTKIKPLSPFVKEKIFRQEPTLRQVKAIEIALNAPDIVLIQGPPGTGKTTVITAILERLNEIENKTNTVYGNVLATGFQHDAVENIISRLSVNSLPSVKFGRRSGASEFSVNAVSDRIEQWCRDIAQKIRDKNPQIADSEHQLRLGEFFQVYAFSPSLHNAIALLEEILSLPRHLLSSDLVRRTNDLLELLTLEEQGFQDYNQENLTAIYALRTTKEGLADDGPERAMDVLEYCASEIGDEERALLKKFICREERKKFLLHDLKKLKRKLLDIYAPRPFFRIEKPRSDMLELIAKVSQQLKQRENDDKNKTEIVQAELLHELENNPLGVRKSVADYTYVFAATCQQADGKDIKRAKRKYNEVDLIRYDTVIVDEAARTSPRDLLIPMVQAKKRIILVGDHRQLPHLIDDAVAKALESKADEASEKLNTDFIKKSMFEYLFHRLKKLEDADKICRTVTLNAQYRMHPVLGKFISDQFYEPHGEGFKSPLPAKLFAHNLPGTDNNAITWLEVPIAQGAEKKSGTSRCRQAEARRIASQLKEWIDSKEGEKLSFGIISFYRAQVNVILKELLQYGITERSPDGSLVISRKYRFTMTDDKNASQERLRIGTVDSFQGMEFDVVFLSVVRSRKKLPVRDKEEKNRKKQQRNMFGHLMSVNRLCVSMSRQKRLLAVVGDSRIVKHVLAREAIPALCKFYRLCKKEGTIL